MHELVNGIIIITIYFAVLASGALLIRRFCSIPNEIFRKLLHFILLGSLLVWTLVFESWWMVSATAIGFAIVVYPILMAAEHLNGYSEIMTERRKGELKQSLLVVFFMYALVVAICWGWQNDRLLAICSIYAWGFGDAAAALVGKKFGKHPLKRLHIEGCKSVEGSLAMFVVSFICVLVILVFRGGMSWYAYPLIALTTAVISAVVELYTKNGLDTITCPLAALAVLLPMVHMFGGISL